MSEETKKLISIANTGKLKGRPSPLKGIIHSVEHNKKISISTSKALLQPGMKPKLQTRLGKPHSEESKQKSRLSNTGKKRTEEFRKKMHHVGIRNVLNHRGPYKNTKPELLVKQILIELGFNENTDFIHQYYIKDIKHSYVADFVFPNNKIVIEEDGIWCHNWKGQVEKDEIRTREMEEIGYKVLRVTDYNVLNNYDNVKQEINNFIQMRGD